MGAQFSTIQYFQIGKDRCLFFSYLYFIMQAIFCMQTCSFTLNDLQVTVSVQVTSSGSVGQQQIDLFFKADHNRHIKPSRTSQEKGVTHGSDVLNLGHDINMRYDEAFSAEDLVLDYPCGGGVGVVAASSGVAAVAIPLTPDVNPEKQCSLCGYSTRNNGNMSRHLKSHTLEKPYSCPFCSYRCRQKAGLQRHLTIHTGERPFQCTECNFSTTMKFRLEQHEKTHHSCPKTGN